MIRLASSGMAHHGAPPGFPPPHALPPPQAAGMPPQAAQGMPAAAAQWPELPAAVRGEEGKEDNATLVYICVCIYNDSVSVSSVYWTQHRCRTVL